MRVLLLGDVIGKPGRRILSELLEKFKHKHHVDFVVANGENAAGGSGLTSKLAKKLRKFGVDVVTHGDHVLKKPENRPALEECGDWLVRPHNYVDHNLPGKGYVVVEKQGVRIGVINVVGNVFLAEKAPSPFQAVDDCLSEIKTQCDIILVDIHAEASSEKIAMGWYLDGKVSVVFGTHTHVQTADERILPKGTGYITDLGMTGPYDSVIGRNTECVLQSFVHKEYNHFSVAEDNLQIRGIMVDIDVDTGKAYHIERVVIREDDPLQDIALRDLIDPDAE